MELRSCICFRIFPSVLIEEKPRQLLCIVTSAWSNPSLDIQKQLIGTEYSLQKSSKEANFLRLFQAFRKWGCAKTAICLILRYLHGEQNG